LYASTLKLISNALSAGLACGKNCTKSLSVSIVPVSEFTTVPLPAAVWLLGSALAGLVAFGRRRREAGPEVLSAASA
jgi:hypothetical protein